MAESQLNVALIGSGFMARSHSLAYAMLPLLFDVPRRPVLHTLADVNDELAREGAQKFGFLNASSNWQAVVEDPNIDVVLIATPNNVHREMAEAAIAHGKHIYCEKPLAMTAADAKAMADAAEQAGVATAVGFNYRKNPSALAMKDLIDSGALGRIFHFRGGFFQDWAVDPNTPLAWRFQRKIAGSGSLGDLGSHVIDFVRFLIGEVTEVSALTETFIKERPVATGAKDLLGTGKGSDPSTLPRGTVDVDDAVIALLRYENGAIGTLEATRFATGHKSQLLVEINGSGGSLIYDHNNLNEFKVYLHSDNKGMDGFRTVMVGPEHPLYMNFWPVAGLGIGFQDTKVIDMYEFLQQITEGKPSTNTFRDGWKVQQVTDAIDLSANERRWVKIDEV